MTDGSCSVRIKLMIAKDQLDKDGESRRRYELRVKLPG